MTNTSGAWVLYIVLYDVSASRWPERRWRTGEPIPTPVQRAECVSTLGYEVLPGVEWEWCETSRDLDDPTSPVELIATVAVRPSTVVGGRGMSHGAPDRVGLLREAVAAKGGVWTTGRVLALFHRLCVPITRAACQSSLATLTREGVLGRFERTGLRYYAPTGQGGAS
ncbi:DUF6303 family protein [Streptantibioticus rubrisoli]|uniref:DUF6303 family protein n=1 Tax=Streptantibioticus rubrisoli TaxID=1387313 RepID=A0ABT1PK84_9ACTN|nr:DUF6303 family protein [Streptantibioticus rubrisoli]MCQ4044653.1 DUF6303 family protein [Streptantibioticus rubrisoli]